MASLYQLPDIYGIYGDVIAIYMPTQTRKEQGLPPKKSTMGTTTAEEGTRITKGNV